MLRDIQEFTASQGVSTEVVLDGEGDEELDATLFASGDDWTVVLWPDECLGSDAAICRELSKRERTVVSHISIYDGDYWDHRLFQDDKLVDQHCSRPDYWTEKGDDREQERRRWQGNAEVVAAILGIEPDSIRPYLIHRSPEPARPSNALLQRLWPWRKTPGALPAEQLPKKAHPDDRCELDDVWVFVDFWRRMGIHYPEDMTRFAHRLRLSDGFAQLPGE